MLIISYYRVLSFKLLLVSLFTIIRIRLHCYKNAKLYILSILSILWDNCPLQNGDYRPFIY